MAAGMHMNLSEPKASGSPPKDSRSYTTLSHSTTWDDEPIALTSFLCNKAAVREKLPS